MSHWPLAFFELFVVLAFGIGWLILEWQGRRLDRAREQREREAERTQDDQPGS